MIDAGSTAIEDLAQALAPPSEGEARVNLDFGTVTALDPFTVMVRGVSVPYALRLHSYQRAAAGDKVFVLRVGPVALVLGPRWSVDNMARLVDIPTAPPPPTPPAPPPPPPAPSTLVVRDFPLTGIRQYRGDPWWQFPTGNHMNYGYDSSRFQYRTAWVVDAAAVRTAIAGKSVQSVQVYLHNLNTYRGTGTQVVLVEQHGSAVLPDFWSQVARQKVIAIWTFPVPPGEWTAWLDVTSTVDLSVFQGFALPDRGLTDFTTYGYCAGPYDSINADPPILRVAWWQ